MGCKFSFKRVFLVASLSLAGLFGISSIAINKTKSSESVFNQTRADEELISTLYVSIESKWNKNSDGSWKTTKVMFYNTTDTDYLHDHPDTTNPYFVQIVTLSPSLYGDTCASASVPTTAKSFIVCNEANDNDQAHTEATLLSTVSSGLDLFIVDTNYDGWWGTMGYRQNGRWEKESDWFNIPDKIFIDVSECTWQEWGDNKSGQWLYESVYIYFWNDSEVKQFGDFPGKKVTTTVETIYDVNGLYRGKSGCKMLVTYVPEGAQYCIVSVWNKTGDSKCQTVSMTLPNGVDRGFNLLSVVGENHYYGGNQEAEWRKPPFKTSFDGFDSSFSKRNVIFFEFAPGSAWDFGGTDIAFNSIKAYFFSMTSDMSMSKPEYAYPGIIGNVYETTTSNKYKYFEVPDWATHVIFTVYDGKNGDYDDNWRKTVNVTLNCNEKIVYTLAGSQYYDMQNVTTSHSPTNVMNSTLTPTSGDNGTARLFINNTYYGYNSSNVWYTLSSVKYAIRCWGGSNSNTESTPFKTYSSDMYLFSDFFNGDGYEKSSWESSYGRWYSCVDIPVNTTMVQIVLVDSSNTSSIKYASPIMDIDDDSFSVCYIIETCTDNGTGYREHDKYPSVWYTPIIEDSATQYVGATLMQKVLEGYSTCSDSPRNGCGAIDNIKDFFYINFDKNKKTGAHSLTFYTLGGNTLHTIEEAIAIMEERHVSSYYPGAVRNKISVLGFDVFEGTNNFLAIVIIASSVSILSITTLSILLIKKRKSKEQ